MNILIRKNSSGVILSGGPILKNPSFGTGAFYSNGDPIVDWPRFQTDDSDDFGFDLNHVESNGSYYADILLPHGTMLVRYGNEYGRFTAPLGTKYSEIALPYIEESVEYHEYRVLADSITVKCEVRKGMVAPKFDSLGGGVQYYHLNGTIRELVRNNVLERIV